MITHADSVKQLTHRYSGNGWAVVQFHHPGYCRVVNVTKDGIGKQVFTSCTDLLTPEMQLVDIKDSSKGRKEMLLNTEQLTAVQSLQSDLESGRKAIVASHIRDV